MGGLWPEANQSEKKGGWTLSVQFLESVEKLMDETDESGSLEVIENCLLAASKIEIENYMDSESGFLCPVFEGTICLSKPATDGCAVCGESPANYTNGEDIFCAKHKQSKMVKCGSVPGDCCIECGEVGKHLLGCKTPKLD